MKKIIICCFGVFAFFTLPVMANQGRYTISNGPEGTFILDTQEGNLWLYTSGKHLPRPMMEKVQYKHFYDSESKRIHYSDNPCSRPLESIFEAK